MGERLRGLAQAHVVGQDAGEVVAYEMLQPGQAFELVGAQLGAEARRCGDGADALGVAQARGDRGDLLASAAGQVEVGQAGGVELRQPPVVVGAVEEVDQRAHQRLDARRANAQAAQGLVLQDHRLVVVDVVQASGKPARIVREQAGEQRRQRQCLAVDLDARRQAEPAVLVLVDVEHQVVDIDGVVAEVGREGDLPAFRAQRRHGLGHEVGPGRLARQPERIGGQAAEARLHRTRRDAGEAGRGEALRGGALGLLVAGQARAAAVGQGVEEAGVAGIHGDRAVAESDQGEVELVGAVGCVLAKARVVGGARFQAQHRHRRAAELDRWLAAQRGRGEGGGHLGQGLGDQLGFGLGERRQPEQALHQLCGHLQRERATLGPGGVDVPGWQQRQHAVGGRFHPQRRGAQAVGGDRPVGGAGARLAQAQHRAGETAEMRAAAGEQPAHQFVAVAPLERQAVARVDVAARAVRPQQAQQVEVGVVDEGGRRLQRALDVAPALVLADLAVLVEAHLVAADAEVAAVQAGLDDIAQRVADRGRPALARAVLREAVRGLAKTLHPGQHLLARTVGAAALVQPHQHHRRHVLAAIAHRAGA